MFKFPDLDYPIWNNTLRQKIEERKIKINFDLPPKSSKSQKAESAVVFLFGQIYEDLG